MDVKNVVEKFTASIDFSKTDYTSEELVKLLKSFMSKKKRITKKNSENTESIVKKPLSAYNIFIRNKMVEYKTLELAPKDKLKKAVESWNEHKKNLSTTSSS